MDALLPDHFGKEQGNKGEHDNQCVVFGSPQNFAVLVYRYMQPYAEDGIFPRWRIF